MFKKRSTFFLLVVLLTGCGNLNSHSSIIDWVDFIKWDGKDYAGIDSGVLADPSFIGEKVGMVKFKVDGNVTDSTYKTRNGDAAFHEKGTAIYKLKGQEDLLAVKNSRSINGYEVYFTTENARYHWRYKDMPAAKVKKIEIYQAYTADGTKLLNTITNKSKVIRFLQLLEKGKTAPNFQPDTKKGDPLYYEMTFYTGEPVAYKYSLLYDGKTYFWYPDDTAVLSQEIKDFIP
ncbi:hypothetical protein LRR81_19555 [Metabacillus sp. GX 13764]|uniref:hypothetical protein n=1 Tax=Metabacillus kandeliae TaxID=2900151 RepID=UPI001E570714|nr:hypothetical protein [Metabacillus kandeliae]MCD7036448.1 hypothetical protein [Metabacillus kandeliae]